VDLCARGSEYLGLNSLNEYRTVLAVKKLAKGCNATWAEINMKWIDYLCTYDLYSPVHNVLDACMSITRASGRGLGPGILVFFVAL
jgi:hypothetical protein